MATFGLWPAPQRTAWASDICAPSKAERSRLPPPTKKAQWLDPSCLWASLEPTLVPDTPGSPFEGSLFTEAEASALWPFVFGPLADAEESTPQATGMSATDPISATELNVGGSSAIAPLSPASTYSSAGTSASTSAPTSSAATSSPTGSCAELSAGDSSTDGSSLDGSSADGSSTTGSIAPAATSHVGISTSTPASASNAVAPAPTVTSTAVPMIASSENLRLRPVHIFSSGWAQNNVVPPAAWTAQLLSTGVTIGPLITLEREAWRALGRVEYAQTCHYRDIDPDNILPANGQINGPGDHVDGSSAGSNGGGALHASLTRIAQSASAFNSATSFPNAMHHRLLLDADRNLYVLSHVDMSALEGWIRQHAQQCGLRRWAKRRRGGPANVNNNVNGAGGSSAGSGGSASSILSA